MLRSSSLSKDNPWSIYDLEANHHLIYLSTMAHHGLNQVIFSMRTSKGLNQEIEDFFEYIKPKPMENLIRVSVQQRIIGVIEDLWPQSCGERSTIKCNH